MYVTLKIPNEFKKVIMDVRLNSIKCEIVSKVESNNFITIKIRHKNRSFRLIINKIRNSIAKPLFEDEDIISFFTNVYHYYMSQKNKKFVYSEYINELIIEDRNKTISKIIS